MPESSLMPESSIMPEPTIPSESITIPIDRGPLPMFLTTLKESAQYCSDPKDAFLVRVHVFGAKSTEIVVLRRPSQSIAMKRALMILAGADRHDAYLSVTVIDLSKQIPLYFGWFNPEKVRAMTGPTIRAPFCHGCGCSNYDGCRTTASHSCSWVPKAPVPTCSECATGFSPFTIYQVAAKEQS